MSSKSTFSNSTSNSYAVALYELSKENSELNDSEKIMKSLKNLLNDSTDFQEMVLSPTITKEDKENVINSIANKNNFSETIKKFLGFVTTKNRLFYLDKIIESFLNLTSNNKGELKAKLISSKELTTDQQNKIKAKRSIKKGCGVKLFLMGLP